MDNHKSPCKVVKLPYSRDILIILKSLKLHKKIYTLDITSSPCMDVQYRETLRGSASIPKIRKRTLYIIAEPHSSVDSMEDFRTGCRCFESPTPPIVFPRIDDSHCDGIHSSLTPLSIVSTMVTWLGKNIVQSTG